MIMPQPLQGLRDICSVALGRAIMQLIRVDIFQLIRVNLAIDWQRCQLQYINMPAQWASAVSADEQASSIECFKIFETLKTVKPTAAVCKITSVNVAHRESHNWIIQL